MARKKIVLHSNHCRIKTGFGKHMKHLLTYLYKNDNYEVIEFANSRSWSDPNLSLMPWKCIGSLPSDQPSINEIKSHPSKERSAGYGHYKIDDLIKQEKPDIYLAIEDIWGVDGFWNKKWWDKISSIIWTPVDSLPLLDKHIEAVSKTKNIIVQASFAKKAFEDKGFKNVHLMPVPIDTDSFNKLNDNEKKSLRRKYSINEKDFIIGFVFRNQLRKSVPNLLDGFKLFKKSNPDSNAKLLLHTHWGEGWDINKFLIEKNINKDDVLTTYYCDKCKQYEIKPFSGQDLNCPLCGSEKSQQTSQVTRGVSESQLNEIYNLMDVYCHPFTSGGQEIPIQEAKLTELVTLVTNYACGEDYCTKESGGLPLDWSEYREHGTQFIKASTNVSHISEQLSNVYNMTPQKRREMGKIARDFVIDFCSIESVCKNFENLISTIDSTDWDFDFSYVEKNTSYIPPEIENNKDWLIDLYKNILQLKDPEQEDPKVLSDLTQKLDDNSTTRQNVYNHFIKIATEENNKNKLIPFEDLLSKDDAGRRILFVLPDSNIDVFNSTSLLKYIKDKHPEHNIYYATKQGNINLLNGNPHIYKTVLYNDIMENFLWGEGQGVESGMFDFVIIPYGNTRDKINYIHGQKHKIEYDLNYA